MALPTGSILSPDPAVGWLNGTVFAPSWANLVQGNVNGWVAGTNSQAGAIVDGIGGVTSGARGATSALVRAQASDTTARSITDYLGFRTGPTIEVYDNFFAWIATAGVKTAFQTGTPGGFQVTTTTNTVTSREACATALGNNTGLFPTGALRLELNASRANTDSIFCFSPAYYCGSDNGSTSYILNTCVTVTEFAFCFHNTLTATDHAIGLHNQLGSTDPISGASVSKAALRYAPTAKSDTTIKLVTAAGGADNVVDTGITPTASTVYRCRLEVHRSGTPLGALARVFINGAVTSTVTTLPILNPLGADMGFQAYTKSTSTGAKSGIEIGYFKALTMPLGALASGALTSDV